LIKNNIHNTSHSASILLSRLLLLTAIFNWNKHITSILSLAFLLLLNTCKYDEGPAISFRNWETRFEGIYTVKRILVNDIDMTQQYKDTCNCKFNFPSKTVDFNLYNCKADNGVSEITGSFFTGGHAKMGFAFYGKSSLSDSAYGFGPLDYDLKSVWKIHRLTMTETNMEADFEGNHYRLEIVED
jgi:hypothetical protein